MLPANYKIKNSLENQRAHSVLKLELCARWFCILMVNFHSFNPYLLVRSAVS